MIRQLQILLIALVAYVGMHLPRSFAILYLIAILACVLARKLSPVHPIRPASHSASTGWNLSLAYCASFSVAFVSSFLFWGFWTWSDNAADIINALILPPLLFFAGTRLGSCGRSLNTSFLLAYCSGGLVFALLALAISRSPWWDISQVFTSNLFVPWGNPDPVSVRSVEQNAFPAFLMITPACILLIQSLTFKSRLWGVVLLVQSFLGAHIVISLDGRLGWLALFLSFLPCFPWIASSILNRGSWNCSGPLTSKHLVTLFGLGVLVVVLTTLAFGAFSTLYLSKIWSQGLCDERLGMFFSMLQSFHEAPFGGRLLQVIYPSCIQGEAPLMLANVGGSISAVHNVPLEVYYSTGILAFVLLIAFLSIPLVAVVRSFLSASPYADWQRSLRWTWFCLLLFEWCFQPLLYSDGLLYYFSFMVLGAFAQQFRAERGLRLSSDTAPSSI